MAEPDVLSIFSEFHLKNNFDLLPEDPRFLKPPLGWFGARLSAPQDRVCPGRANRDSDMCSFKIFLVLKKSFFGLPANDFDYDFIL